MKTITLHELLDDILGPLINKADWYSLNTFPEDAFETLRLDLDKIYQKYAETESKLPGDGD